MDRFQHQCAECAGSGRCVLDDFIAVADGYWFRDGISDWKERRGTVYNQNAGVIGAEDARKEVVAVSE